jgi:hypothetical protein
MVIKITSQLVISCHFAILKSLAELEHAKNCKLVGAAGIIVQSHKYGEITCIGRFCSCSIEL